MRTRIFGFPKKLKRSQNYDFLQKIKAALCSAALCVVFYVLLIFYTFAD